MEITGFIKQVLEARSGTSARTGNQWKIQSYVLETVEQYPKHLVFDVKNDNIQKFALREGDVVAVSFDVDANEYQGKWYNKVVAWKVEKKTTSAPSPNPSQGVKQVNFSGNNDNPPF